MKFYLVVLFIVFIFVLTSFGFVLLGEPSTLYFILGLLLLFISGIFIFKFIKKILNNKKS